MKNLKVLLKNACEDYFTHLNHEPTIEDVREVSTTNLADVVWDAVTQACANRNITLFQPSEDPIINDMRRSKTEVILCHMADRLMGKPVGDFLPALRIMFRNAETYGFKFSYGTTDGIYDEVAHDSWDKTKIIAYFLTKK